MAAAVLKSGTAAGGRRRWPRRLIVIAVIAAYPLFVLGYVYGHSLTSGLPGPRHGPQDAYRHTLASAVVAYTISPVAVDWVTTVMEFSDHPSSRMDRHNNAIGAAIGTNAFSFAQIQPLVRERVASGRVNAADPRQVTWMPRHTWRELPF